MKRFTFDTETFLMRPGSGAPPMVCLQWTDGETIELLRADDAKPRFERALQSELIIGHNVAFDMCVAMAKWPDLIPAVFAAYADNRVTDTMLREQLIDIADGTLDWLNGKPFRYSLGECAQKRLGIEMDKTDPWRLRYGLLSKARIADYPDGARDYAMLDAETTNLVWEDQEETRAGILADQYRQARKGLWLRLMECWGVRTDPEHVEAFIKQTEERIEKAFKTCVTEKLVRLNGTKDTKAAMARMVQVCREIEEPFKLTDTAQKLIKAGEDENVVRLNAVAYLKYIALDEEACEASGDPVLIAYQTYSTAETALTRAKKLRHGYDLPIQPSYTVLRETGRTSCREGKGDISHGFQMQNLPRAAGLRECFIPRDGHVFCSVDMDAAELCAWAQCCLWICGQSVMAEVINEGRDPHTELAARVLGLDVARGYAQRKGAEGAEAKDAFDKIRTAMKVLNFGLPTGMSHHTARTNIRKTHGYQMTIAQAFEAKRAWSEQWPESVKYFEWVREMTENGRAQVAQFRSNRLRGGCSYTETANTPFQGLVADAMGAAGFELARECYAVPSSPLFGSRFMLFNHDEFILEIPEDRAHEAATRQAEIQREVMQGWMPDVKISCAPALMRRWSKKAETVRDENGRLVVWEAPAKEGAV